MLTILVAEAVALVFLAMLVVGLLRSHAEILRRLHELGEGLDDPPAAAAGTTGAARAGGSAAHDVSGWTLNGEAVALGLVGAPGMTLLAFLSATCHTCEPFWAALHDGAAAPEGARVVVVVQEGDSRARLRSLAGPDLLVIASDQAWADYEVPGSPHVVAVADGRVRGEGTGASWQQVCDLLTHARGRVVTPPDELPQGRDNPQRVDLELLAAGIGPGHPSLYPDEAGGSSGAGG